MNINYKSFTGYLLVLIISIAFTFFYAKKTDSKIAYIDLQKTFKEFELKKELETKLNQVKTERQGILDSLEFELKVISKELQSNKAKDENKFAVFQTKRDQFLTKKEEFMQENENLSAQFDNQIYTQMNQYVKDFGLENGYGYILGADGAGVLMYARESENITDDVVKFINDRYKGNVK